MRFRTGNMLLAIPKDTVVLVTTNAVVKRSGELVMGAGAALHAARHWPELPKLAGKAIPEMKAYGMMILMGLGDNRHVGIFQTKYHYVDPSDMGLIALSAGMVRKTALSATELTFRINYPGIGLGGLSPQQVRPVLDEFFGDLDNVEIWTL